MEEYDRLRVEDSLSHGGENNLIVNRQDKVVRDQIKTSRMRRYLVCPSDENDRVDKGVRL